MEKVMMIITSGNYVIKLNSIQPGGFVETLGVGRIERTHNNVNGQYAFITGDCIAIFRYDSVTQITVDLTTVTIEVCGLDGYTKIGKKRG